MAKHTYVICGVLPMVDFDIVENEDINLEIELK